MSAAIIGGAGFVGLNLCERLAGEGRRVTVADPSPLPEDARAHFAGLSGEVVHAQVDVHDARGLASALEGAETVFYGAAITAGPEREAREPEAILAVNLGGVAPALRASLACGARRFVNLGSAAAYGAAGLRFDLLEEEATPVDPRALYPITKFASERLASRLGELWGIEVVNVRLGGVFGPWERSNATRDTLSPHFQILRLLAEGREALLPREGMRDWLYAPDAARALALLADARALSHVLYNIGPGERWSVLAWGGEAARALGLPPERIRLAGPGEKANVDLHAPGDRGSLDIARLEAQTGFAPDFGLEASARHLVAWWRGHGYS